MDAITPNLGLIKPDVGASDDTWGNKLNDNFDILDTGVLEAPNDGKVYGRENKGWSALVRITVGPTAPSSPAVNDVWIDTT